MAFPTPASRTEGTTAAGTSHAIPMPATVNAGDGLLVMLRALGDFNSTPSGWSELHEYTPGSMRTAAYYKVADGTEGGTSPTWGTATSVGVRYFVYRITGVHASTIAESNTLDVGNSTAPDVSSLSPSFGGEDILWIIQLGTGNSRTPTVPTNYGNLLSSNATMHACERQLNAASEDPGAWALSGTDTYCVTHLIAIRPAAASVTVTPATASLALTGFAPTVQTPRLATPGVAALALTAFAPSVNIGTLVTPAPASLALTGFAPSVLTPRLVTPEVAALVLTAFAPEVGTSRTVTPETLALLLTFFAPSVSSLNRAGFMVLEADLDDDGVFETDWSDLVLQLDTRTGADLAAGILGKASAGNLVALLNNQDDRFSFFNTASPHYGKLYAGHKVRLRSETAVDSPDPGVLAEDDFRRVDGDLGNAGTRPVANLTAASSEYLSRADAAALELGDADFTIAFRFRLASLGADRAAASKYNATGNQRGWIAGVSSSNRARFIASADGSAETTVSPAEVLSASTWYSAIIRHDAAANTIEVILDGALSGDKYASGSHSGGIFNSTAALNLGAVAGASQFWNGQLSQFGVWTRKLADYELADLYNGGDGRWHDELVPELLDGLLGYWDLDEYSAGTGAVSRTDKSGAALTLTDNNTTPSTPLDASAPAWAHGTADHIVIDDGVAVPADDDDTWETAYIDAGQVAYYAQVRVPDIGAGESAGGIASKGGLAVRYVSESDCLRFYVSGEDDTQTILVARAPYGMDRTATIVDEADALMLREYFEVHAGMLLGVLSFAGGLTFYVNGVPRTTLYDGVRSTVTPRTGSGCLNLQFKGKNAATPNHKAVDRDIAGGIAAQDCTVSIYVRIPSGLDLASVVLEVIEDGVVVASDSANLGTVDAYQQLTDTWTSAGSSRAVVRLRVTPNGEDDEGTLKFDDLTLTGTVSGSIINEGFESDAGAFSIGGSDPTETQVGLSLGWGDTSYPVKLDDFNVWDGLPAEVDGILFTGEMAAPPAAMVQRGPWKTAQLRALGPLAGLNRAVVLPASSNLGSQDGTGTLGEYAGVLVGQALALAGAQHPPGPVARGYERTAPFGLTKQSALQAAQLFAELEIGRLEELPEGYLALRDRRERVGTTSLATFSDAPGATLPYEAIEQRPFADEIYNRIVSGVTQFRIADRTAPPAFDTLATLVGPIELGVGEEVIEEAAYSGLLYRWRGVKAGGVRAQAEDFPELLGITETIDNTGGSSIDVAMPASVAAGDYLLMDFVASSDPSATPSGWTYLGDQNGEFIYGKIADGTEGGTSVTVNLPGPSDTGVAHVYQVAAHANFDWQVEIVAAADATSENPSELVTVARRKILWIVTIGRAASGAMTVSAGGQPSGYTFGEYSAATDAYLATAYKLADAGSEDPGAWTISGNSGVSMFTIAIGPPAASYTDEKPLGIDGRFILPYDAAIGGSSPVEYVDLEVGGEIIEQTQEEVVTSDDAPSQRRTRTVRSYDTPARFFADRDRAELWNSIMLSLFKGPHPSLAIRFTANKSDELMTQALERRVGDRITLVAENNSGLGISRDFFIEEIFRTFRPGTDSGPLQQVTFELSEASRWDALAADLVT